MSRPWALDLYCGAGGAAEGLQAAGYYVVGVDIEDHSAVYPGEFIQADVRELDVDLSDFAFVWASPPCQFASIARKDPTFSGDVPNLIPTTRELLSEHPLTAIENVPPARRLGPMRDDLRLSGPMFGLYDIERARIFELSWPVRRIHTAAPKRDTPPLPITKHLSFGESTWRRWQEKYPDLKACITVDRARRAMGVKAPMTARQIGEAVPPVFAEYIGRLALRYLEWAA